MHTEHADERRLNRLSGNVIGRAFNVLNTLGAGFLEKINENAQAIESRERGLGGLVVDEMALALLKTARAPDDTHRPHRIDHLKGTRLRLSCNSASPKPEIKRFAHGI